MTYWTLLKKMRGCNWQDLAKDLGTTPQTLRRWRADTEAGLSAGKAAAAAAHSLFHRTLAEHECEWISISYLNFDNIRTIGGRR